MQVKASQAASLITASIKARLVPLLVGSPGMGKSSIVQQIAEKYSLKVIDLRLSQCDPTDLLGFPTISDGRGRYAPMETFPVEGDPIPEGFTGWLLFLDEFTSAMPAVQAAAYKIVLDRMVGLRPLHRNVAIACAGNLETDGAIVNTMSTALQSRLVHLELVIDTKEWIDWALQNQFDHRITDFIGFKPESLYTFRPDHTDNTYACPRTWEFANRLMTHLDPADPFSVQGFAGVLSEGVAREFLTFCKIYKQLPKVEVMLRSPETISIPQEPSILYAMSGSISENVDTQNFGQFNKLIRRLPSEFQVITLRKIIKRNQDLMSHPVIAEWSTKAAHAFF